MLLAYAAGDRDPVTSLFVYRGSFALGNPKILLVRSFHCVRHSGLKRWTIILDSARTQITIILAWQIMCVQYLFSSAAYDSTRHPDRKACPNPMQSSIRSTRPAYVLYVQTVQRAGCIPAHPLLFMQDRQTTVRHPCFDLSRPLVRKKR